MNISPTEDRSERGIIMFSKGDKAIVKVFSVHQDEIGVVVEALPDPVYEGYQQITLDFGPSPLSTKHRTTHTFLSRDIEYVAEDPEILARKVDEFVDMLQAEGFTSFTYTKTEDGSVSTSVSCEPINNDNNRPHPNHLSPARQFCMTVRMIASEHNMPFFVVAPGASAYSNRIGLKSDAVEHARKAHILWEKANGIDPCHDWYDQ
jgi:hypothetical protein